MTPSREKDPSQRSVALRVLFVEDSADDATLVARELRRGGYDLALRRVDSRSAMLEALEEPWDLIISDFAMPSFTGMDALQLVRERGLDVPFLLVSGTIGEETAVLAMKAGAHDYLLKGSLGRLVPAVSRELREAEVRRERRRAEDSLRFLAECSVALAESLDYRVTLTRVARTAVPFIGDWCAVDLVDERGVIQRVATAHAVPARERLLSERLPPHGSVFAARVLRSGAAELMAEVTDEILVAWGADVAECALVRELGTETALAVPLAARGKTLGAIAVGAAGRRHYGPADVTLAHELARRAALAIDNARLYLSAQEAIREARMAVSARDEFLLIAAHELRTPLTPLLLQVQRARLAVKADDAEKVGSPAWLLERAEGQVRRFANLVNTLLDVSRLATDAVTLELSSFDLSALLREVAPRFAEDARRAGSTLSVEAGEPIVGTWDRVRLDQVISNLLSNALKYGAGKPIEARVLGTDETASIVIRDHEIGIPIADQSRIFGRFERAVPVSHYGGFGLGLWIVRKVVDALGGTIRIDGAVGVGSAFTVDLPRSRGAPEIS